MSKRPYQHLPPLEHRPDGSPYRITPPQKRRASGLIRRECCNCEDGNCLALDDGVTPYSSLMAEAIPTASPMCSCRQSGLP